jgi:hypothetical protein
VVTVLKEMLKAARAEEKPAGKAQGKLEKEEAKARPVGR